ncbi:MAG: hypothetical protein A3J85_02585 [Desulfobacula sp. RIFOXYA12_FULL_46_16]|nr:MAG: hypothetical protein A3J85_02585 [Desulfobacula sp. RIFOXYA12_FULL_46_16]
MKNINLLLPNPLLIYHEKFSPRIAVPAFRILIIDPDDDMIRPFLWKIMQPEWNTIDQKG